MKLPTLLLSFALASTAVAQAPIIVDHRCTDLGKVPAGWITRAKQSLRIVYGHTSHGSQVTSGMSGLVTFTGGCGGAQFAWSRTGSGGTLALHDGGMAGDCGYYPQWVNNTTAYLDNPANAATTVVMWSWCGQVSGYTSQMMLDRYLKPMDLLEKKYPGVRFVYMTGHTEISSHANTNARNKQIRDWCLQNNKILFDFADIESYDPDERHYPYVDDSCDYFDAQLVKRGNWATEWQNRHTQGVDWYSCPSAHSQPLNANLKAYAIWWLWARLAGWEGDLPLQTDGRELSGGKGGAASLILEGGAQWAGSGYLLLAGASGTSPGFTIPNSTTVVPLNMDLLTSVLLMNLGSPVFVGFAGTLDAAGRGKATLATPAMTPAVAGYTMNFAWLTYAPFGFVSNPAILRFVP